MRQLYDYRSYILYIFFIIGCIAWVASSIPNDNNNTILSPLNRLKSHYNQYNNTTLSSDDDIYQLIYTLSEDSPIMDNTINIKSTSNNDIDNTTINDQYTLLSILSYDITVPHPYRVFDISRLGVSLYLITLVYMCFLLLALARIRLVFRFVPIWSALKLLYVMICIHLLTRVLGFGGIAFFTLADLQGQFLYQLQAILFTFPEYCFILIYILLLVQWVTASLNAYTHSELSSRSQCRRYTRYFFFISTLIILILAIVCYILFWTNIESNLIEESCAGLNILVVCVGTCILIILNNCILAGYEQSSHLALQIVKKLNVALMLTSFGRLARGIVFILSLLVKWQQKMQNNTLTMSIVSILVVCEYLSILLLLDWRLLSVLLGGEDLAESRTGNEPSIRLFGRSNNNNNNNNTNSSSSHHFSRTSSDISVHSGLLDHSHGGIQHNSSLSALYHDEQFTKQTMNGPHFLLSAINLPQLSSLPTNVPEPNPGQGIFEGVYYDKLTTSQQIIYSNPLWVTASGSLHDGRRVAVKRFHLPGIDTTGLKELASEAYLRCQNLNCINILPLTGFNITNNYIYLISEYKTRRSLFDLLRTTSKSIAPTGIIRLSLGIAQAMDSLHSNDLVHGHLKSRNILLDEELSVFITDCGHRFLRNFSEAIYGTHLHTQWTAPEVMRGNTPTKSSDVWSFGVICWELCYRRCPFIDLDYKSLIREVSQNKRLLPLPSAEAIRHAQMIAVNSGKSITNVVPFEFIRLVEQCLTQPDLRPSFEDIVIALTNLRDDFSRIDLQ